MCAKGICYAGLDCTTLAKKVKPISFILGDKSFTILPEGYLLIGEDYDPKFKGICLFGVSSLPDTMGPGFSEMFIFGDVFLRNYYSVFDWENQ